MPNMSDGCPVSDAPQPRHPDRAGVGDRGWNHSRAAARSVVKSSNATWPGTANSNSAIRESGGMTRRVAVPSAAEDGPKSIRRPNGGIRETG